MRTFIVFFAFLLSSIYATLLANDSVSLTVTTKPLDPSTVTASVLSESAPISSLLFGELHPTPAPASAFNAYVHPRIITSATDWDQLLERYADDTFFNQRGSWSQYHRAYTLSKGPTSSFIADLASLEEDGTTALYAGNTHDLTVLNETELAALRPLVDKASLINELKSGAFFMCAFWSSVSEKRAEMLGEIARFLPPDIKQTCIKATVAWSKILLAHRAYYCNPSCPAVKDGTNGHLWNFELRWEVQNDWYTASSGLGMSYDILYHDMTPEQQKSVRSAIAMLVMKRFSWGNSVTSDRISPNAAIHPHRIFSNWALYHSNLYLTNLAIEKETGFDVYTTAVLSAEGETGFNGGLYTRFTAMIEAYLAHSVYPDGSTFEDGYTYFIALREGSLGLLAAHRRGVTTIGTPRFRNLIHNAMQLYEPWMCGEIIGHASGGGVSYPAHIGLFRFAYPNGALTSMLWKQRMHPNFTDHSPCRIQWHQNMMQLTFLGAEHSSNAESPQGLEENLKALIPKSFYSPRRGLLIARSSLEENAVLIHFDARPDCFYPGHENADRGVITFTAHRKTWLVELPWRENVDSRRHSIMHVDGLAQDEKAPCGRMMKVFDDDEIAIASANLTYSYNVQYARNWPYSYPPTQYVVTYLPNGTSTHVYTEFTAPEQGDPRDFGWPVGDDGADLGLTRPESNMYGDPDMGFLGMWTWKRDYRTVPLEWAVRSAALVRSQTALGYFLIADSFRVTGIVDTHTFESYMIIADDAEVDDSTSSCSGNSCFITVIAPGHSAQLDVHVLTLGTNVSYRTETFDGHNRIVVKSENMLGEEFFVGFNAHDGETEGFKMTRWSSGELQVSYAGEERFFKLSSATHDLEIAEAPTPSPTPTRSSTPSSSPSPSVPASPTPLVSVPSTPLVSVLSTPSVSVSATSVSVSPTSSISVSPTPSVAVSSSSSVSVFPTPSASQPVSPSISSSPAASAPPNPSSLASPTPSPLEAPMKPLFLPFQKKQLIKGTRMKTDASLFLHPTRAKYQVVFKFFSSTPRNRRRGDRFYTCHRSKTNTLTEMAIYDCGKNSVADSNYAARACVMVTESNPRERCMFYRTDFRRRLEKSKIYFLAVSVPNLVKKPQFLIRRATGVL